MTLVGMILMWLGYVLLYAGIANHGRFATQPWAGVYADAYDSGIGTGGLNDIPGIEGDSAPQGRRRGGGDTPRQGRMRAPTVMA